MRPKCILSRRRYSTGKYPGQFVEKPKSLKFIPRHFARYGISCDDFIDRFLQREPSDVINEIKELYEIGVRDYAFYIDWSRFNVEK